MDVYNKLFTKILDSSIWLAPDATRLVWITMIAAMDEDGFCAFATVENLAARARVELKAAKKAVSELESPEPETATPEQDGTRIERVPGGWMVLNAAKYRNMVTRIVQREQTKERVRRHRAKLAGNAPVTVSNAPPLNVTPSEAVSESDASANAGAKRKKTKTLIPTLEEVIAQGAMAGVSEEDCRTWFKDRESEGWADKNGLDIGNWRRYLNIWRDQQRANQHEKRIRNNPQGSAKLTPDYSKGF